MNDTEKLIKGLALLVKTQEFIKDNKIGSSETIFQTDWVAEKSLDLIAELCEIVGYPDFEDEE